MHAPAALMLGPLIAAIVVASSGGKVRMPLPPFVLAQGVVGCLIAKMVPLSIVGDVLSHWVAVHRRRAGGRGDLEPARLADDALADAAWHDGAVGHQPGRRLGDDHHGRVLRRRRAAGRLHAVSACRAGGGRRGRWWRGCSASILRMRGRGIVWFPPVDWLALGETLALAVIGPLIARRLNIPAGAFLVPMVAGIVLTHFGLMSIELPTWLLAASYAFIGWNVGLRFTRPLLIHAARALPRILACILTMIVLCGGVAVLMVWRPASIR